MSHRGGRGEVGERDLRLASLHVSGTCLLPSRCHSCPQPLLVSIWWFLSFIVGWLNELLHKLNHSCTLGNWNHSLFLGAAIWIPCATVRSVFALANLVLHFFFDGIWRGLIEYHINIIQTSTWRGFIGYHINIVQTSTWRGLMGCHINIIQTSTWRGLMGYHINIVQTSTWRGLMGYHINIIQTSTWRGLTPCACWCQCRQWGSCWCHSCDRSSSPFLRFIHQRPRRLSNREKLIELGVAEYPVHSPNTPAFTTTEVSPRSEYNCFYHDWGKSAVRIQLLLPRLR